MKNPEKQKLKEKLDLLRKDIRELALRNYGILNMSMVIDSLDADADMIKLSLKKMKAKVVGNRIFFPKIVWLFAKDSICKILRKIWPFKK